MEVLEIPTPHGLARAQLSAGSRGALILGHGAGGGVHAPDLQAASDVAAGRGLAVALVEQPYRVAGRRAPPPAPQLDAAFAAIVAALRAGPLEGLSLVVGGRSSGARVACRCAAALDAAGVLCLAFPLLPPARANARTPPRSRLDELEAVTVPLLVVQGAGDRFGTPSPAPGREVVTIRGDHSLRSDGPALRAAVDAWLGALWP